MKKYKAFLTVFILFIIINMVIFPDVYIKETLNGVSAWAFNVLPAILPFIFFTKILSELGGIEKASKIFSRPMQKFFKAPAVASYVFFMSIISGYPVGAKMTADLYLSGKITRSEAFRMSSFCSTSGPMFIIGAVGVGMLHGAIAGYIIFVSHIIGAFLNGFLYRKMKAKEIEAEPRVDLSRKADLGQIVSDSAASILSVGVIIAIFFVVIKAMAPLLAFLPAPVAALCEGLIEITKGCMDIATVFSSRFAIVASTFVISFGGISTILQSLTMLDKIKMPAFLFALQKFTQAVISCVVAFLFVLIL